jgi:hypothetical protein
MEEEAIEFPPVGVFRNYRRRLELTSFEPLRLSIISNVEEFANISDRA